MSLPSSHSTKIYLLDDSDKEKMQKLAVEGPEAFKTKNVELCAYIQTFVKLFSAFEYIQRFRASKLFRAFKSIQKFLKLL